MNNNHRKPLQGTQLEYFDVREAVEQIQQALMQNFHTLQKYWLNS